MSGDCRNMSGGLQEYVRGLQEYVRGITGICLIIYEDGGLW